MTLLLLTLLAAAPQAPPDLSDQVEILRTAYGVPHIRAENLRAFGFGLAWVQLEDYGAQVAIGLVRARGEMGRVFGRDSLEGDFLARQRLATARSVYYRLSADTREVYEGFAAGVNRYVERHPEEFPEGLRPAFTGMDVASRDVEQPDWGVARRFVARLAGAPARAPAPDPNEGSNAWALAPSRTRSGHAILLRNPHLQWNAGYYEAHATVPGALDFYGDFRIGGPFTVIGGFNRDLGFATTNNSYPADQVYALPQAPGVPDAVLLDGAVVPLTRALVTAEYRNGPGYASETREVWNSPAGPVIARTGGRVYVLRSAGAEEYRGGEQFLRMMQAGSLAEWKAAMRMQARTTSNFTYADRAGNIFYVWNATLPEYPHPLAGDSVAVPVTRSAEFWTRYVPWDSLPQLLNPKGGYLHNENDPPHFTNLLQPLDSANLPAGVPRPGLSLRSQLALELLTSSRRKLTLEEVVRLKHSPRMLLADRVKPDLLRALSASGDTALAEAGRILGAWDNTAAVEARGAVLFEAWWRRYLQSGPRGTSPYAEPWTAARPVETPRGVAEPARALEALRVVLPEVRRKYGRLDVAWGEVHRVRFPGRDYPVAGCGGELGCFRVLQFREDPDGKLAARGGDGWILAVEFGKEPRAFSVLAYGESNRADSPHYGDQAELFAKGALKPVAFLAREVEAGVVRRYRPGR